MRRLDGELYNGKGCDLYKLDDDIRAAADGNFRIWRWNGDSFEQNSIHQPYAEPVVTYEYVAGAPFDPKHTDELPIGGERKITWQKVAENASHGFVSIDYYGDAAQIYADGILIADSFYYGEIWRVPARLLDGKECYLAVSKIRDDFYREF